MVLRLSVIVQVSSFIQGADGVTRFQRLPFEAMERRAEIVEHGRKVAVQGRTTAD
jgi:hypothetical protein